MVRSGRASGIPYSLSRWTDVPASKWEWFEKCLEAGKMVAFDTQSIAPQVWSLTPEDTLGLVFWTKNPRKLIQHRELLRPYNVIVHMTATGWEEAEEGAPKITEAGCLLADAAEIYKVRWRFSPVPLLPPREILARFSDLLGFARYEAKLDRVYISFLQENDRVPETRSAKERFDILNMLSKKAAEEGVDVILCSDDRSLNSEGSKFTTGACVPAKDFQGPVQFEDCGCVLMADPFTINESCDYKCSYCYAADKSISPEQRDTTA